MSLDVGREPLNNVAYVHDGTTEGLLTAIFQAYALHEQPEDFSTETALQPQLGQSVRYIETDTALAWRVKAGIVRKAGRDAWDAVLHASLSDEPSAGVAIYRFVRHIMAHPAAANSGLIRNLAHPVAGPVVRLDRSVMNERHLMMQFLRFEHFENGIWFAKCNPKANVVPLLMDWFAGRFNTERFVVYDEVHQVAGIYDGAGWYLAQTDEVHLPQHAPDEAAMQAAWKGFYDAMSISARYHPELRRQFMPKRLWRNILEVRDELSGGSGKSALPDAAMSSGRRQENRDCMRGRCASVAALPLDKRL